MFERYSSSYADKLSAEGKLQSGFMVDSILSPFAFVKTYEILVPRNQLVSLLVQPESGIMVNVLGFFQKLNFNLEVYDSKGQLLIESHRMMQLNFAQLAVPEGEKLTVKIRRQGLSARPQNFRLIVVGAEENLFDHFPNITAAE